MSQSYWLAGSGWREFELRTAQVLQALLKVLQKFTKVHTPPSFDLSCTSCSSPATGSPAKNLLLVVPAYINLTCSTMLLQSVQTASMLPSSLSRPDSCELIMLHLIKSLLLLHRNEEDKRPTPFPFPWLCYITHRISLIICLSVDWIRLVTKI